jgi:hypothetical protein
MILLNLELIEGQGSMLRGFGEGLKLIRGTEVVRWEREGDGIGGKLVMTLWGEGGCGPYVVGVVALLYGTLVVYGERGVPACSVTQVIWYGLIERCTDLKFQADPSSGGQHHY